MIRAAFIGIDRYQDPVIRDLTGATRDARALAALLADSIDGVDPILLVDEEAGLDRVRATLDWALGEAGPDDVVLLGFSGHGSDDHRLVLADTRDDSFESTSLAMAELGERLRGTAARAVLIVLDCCFSGGAPARAFEIGLVPRAALVSLANVVGHGQVLLAASREDQPAYEDPSLRHGLLTKAFIDVLVESEGPVGIGALADAVIARVEAAALRLGRRQSPVLFGEIKGSLTLPAGRRGARFRAAFPELAPLQVEGRFEELAACGLPAEVLDAWSARFPDGLNPLQRQAVNAHGVLDGASLLVIAPTSAGKTFIGEMAALRSIVDGRKAIFLLPYKALVNEKHEDFAALYGERLGLRIARCSGDWQDQVGEVLRGKYDIAFFTYEKFLGLSLAAPHLLSQVGLVVLDEAQFLTDPGRGIVVELLLTHLVSARKMGVSPQLVALSAVIGHSNRLERWLDCGLLETQDRPVPLTEGVIDRTGAWTYRTPEGAHATEQLLDRLAVRQRGPKPSSQDVIVPLVRHLVAAGEKVIVFRNRRGPAAGCASYLAEELGLPAAEGVIAMLPDGDRSDTSERLRLALGGGVAFHSSDLDRDERIAVEQGFRRSDGGVSVLVATTTVAAGINTPASTVIIAETNLAGPGAQPITVAQYKNMAGRAGRLGYEASGKAILIADTPFERTRMLRTYVDGAPEPIGSSLDPGHPETWIVRLLAQVEAVERAAVIDLLTSTYGGFLATLDDPAWPERMRPVVDTVLDRMLAEGLLAEEGGRVKLTMLGRACGESPLTLRSALRAVSLIRRLDPDRVTPDALLILLEALPERDDDYVPQARQGEPQRMNEAHGRFGADLARLLSAHADSDRIYYGRCKRALIVRDWIDGVPVAEIEEEYTPNPFSRLGPGDIRGYVDQGRFLLESVLRLASIILERAQDAEAEDRLMKRLELGVPEEALALLDLPITFTRGELLGIVRAGAHDQEVLRTMPQQDLRAILGRKARRLLEHLHEVGLVDGDDEAPARADASEA